MNNYLAHYGVMGMKWGVRRYQPYPKGQQVKGRFLGKTKTVSKSKLESMQKKHEKKTSKQLRKEVRTVRRDILMKPARNARALDKKTNERIQKHFDEYNKKLRESNLSNQERVATSMRILPEVNQLGKYMKQADFAKAAKDVYLNHHAKSKIDAILENSGPKTIAEYKKVHGSTMKDLDALISRGADAEKQLKKKLRETSKNF